ncbi:helix-turn-helix domain-containing protein [Streptomyces sp. HUAS MG91]|uniref:Helix-turn-helix domain-containing protein n=1 Tax=Streptomyces tabacisoli TaxID=3156398 RepID=A0AAU8J1X9_9ACTN
MRPPRRPLPSLGDGRRGRKIADDRRLLKPVILRIIELTQRGPRLRWFRDSLRSKFSGQWKTGISGIFFATRCLSRRIGPLFIPSPIEGPLLPEISSIPAGRASAFPDSPVVDRAFLGVREAAAYLGLSPRTLYVWRHRRQGPPSFRLGAVGG